MNLRQKLRHQQLERLASKLFAYGLGSDVRVKVLAHPQIAEASVDEVAREIVADRNIPVARRSAMLARRLLAKYK